MPHQDCEVEWEHVDGQVEIDTVFNERREKKWNLFVIEAKHGRPGPSLAKHKLAYPFYAVAAKKIPADIEVIPVYLRSWADTEHVYFGIAECQFRAGSKYALTALEPMQQSRILALPLKFI